jgi:aryl-alcohol dehydrogenase-like predicted oxidoreductase
MTQRKIGTTSVGALGLGCMGMSFAYGSPDEIESLRTLDRALELGVNHWDTADMYGPLTNEDLLAKALAGKREKVFLATKFGNVYDRTLTSHQDLVAQNAPWIVDGTPAYARKSLEGSLRRLGVDMIDLYYLHRIDDRVPIEETIGAMAEFVAEGKVRFLGISEAAAETIRRAHAVHPIAAVQNEFSLWTRDFLAEELPLCAALDIALVAYSPLGRGFLTGAFSTPDDIPEGDWRKSNPRFQGENFTKNFEIVRQVRAIAERLEATPAQVALAWTLAQGENVLPIPGTKRVAFLEENAGASEVTLTPEDLAALDGFLSAGSRYAEAFMAFTAR